MTFRWDAEMAEARGRAYVVLSLCFLTPTEEVISDLLGDGREKLRSAIPILKTLNYQTTGLEELLSKLSSGDLDLPLLRSEHTRVFVTSAPKVPCPPYESVYRTEDRLVMSDYALDVVRTYREFGLDKSDDFKDLPEHISAELEFLAYLTRLELSAADAGLDPTEVAAAELDFISDHLMAWVPEFSDCVVNNSKHPIYRTAAVALREFLESDASLLRELT